MQCHEVVLSSATNYVVMEKAEGGTLLDIVRHGPPPEAVARRAPAQRHAARPAPERRQADDAVRRADAAPRAST